MDVELLVVPYDSGHRAVRMGRGPEHLMQNGLGAALESDGHRVGVVEIDCDVEPPTEVTVAFDLARRLAEAVMAARDESRFPFVLAGNCFSAVGTVAGLGPRRTGVIWLDAHGDLNTPETTHSGFLDGMAVATLTGRCWSALASTVPGFAPVDDTRLAFVAVRDLDRAEESTLQRSGMQRVGVGTLRGDVEGALDPVAAAIGARADQFYLHVDLDVLDPEVARANGYAAPGGLQVEEVVATAAAAARHRPIAAAAITAFDPAHDPDGRAAEAATRIARGMLSC